MEVSSLKMAKVFSGGGEVHYVLPHFQREYAWDKTNWQTLLDDAFSIYEVYDPKKEPEHFMGALVVINDGMRSGTIPAFKLVDGQQRLTSVSLCLCALGRIVENEDPYLHKKIRKLLENADERDLIRYKLVPTTKYDDRETYFAIIDGRAINASESKIAQAFDYIYRHLKNKIVTSGIDPERLFLVFANCMNVVFINLNQHERPYEIFESLNAKGKPLTQPDLIRNYIAMKLPESRQESVFQNHWTKIEDLLRETRTVSRIGEMTAFVRHYLAYRSGVLPNKDHIYARFRDRIEAEFNTPDDLSIEVATLQRFATYYDSFVRPANERDSEIAYWLERLNVFESATAYPFLLGAYENFTQGRISRDDFLDGIQVIENYMVRRYLAGEQSGYTNKMFPTLEREIDYSKYGQSLRIALLRRNYPSDNRIRQVLPTLQLYDTRRPQRVVMVLDDINRYLSTGTGGHTVLDGPATIEHIMPQTLSEPWKNSIGPDYEEVHRELLHTIGNLTLVTSEWNASLSNSPFSVKRSRFAEHALLLNNSYFAQHLDKWDATAIRERADHITNIALEIWKAFGEPPVSRAPVGQKPELLNVLGEVHEVKSWREVALIMTECAISLVNDFDSIAATMPTYFSRIERERSRCLPNGWWLYVNLSSSSVLNLCEQLAAYMGLGDEDWEIRLESNN